MIDSIDDLQFLKGDGIDFVQSVKAGDVLSVPLYDVDNVVLCCIALDAEVGIVYLVFSQDGLDRLIINSVCVNCSRDADTSLVPPLEIDLGRGFVQSNTEPLQLVLQYFLVLHRSGGIKDNHN